MPIWLKFSASRTRHAGLGPCRVLEYQDASYARLYAQRLQQVLDAERQADPAAANGYAITIEMARWLALWMAFDDIIRVADLKSRASRWQRVKGEVKAQDDDLLQVYDHFKPGAPSLPRCCPRRWQPGSRPGPPSPAARQATLGLRSRWARTRCSAWPRCGAGQPEVAAQARQPLCAGTGADRTVAGQRGAGHAPALGHRVRGRPVRPPDQGLWLDQRTRKDNLLHIIGHLAQTGTFASDDARAAAIAAARSAALADEAGTALDATLRQHGAPARR